MKRLYCIDCKYYKAHTSSAMFAECSYAPVQSLVTGKLKNHWCEMERVSSTGCGSEGVFYMPVDTPRDYAPDTDDNSKDYHGW